MRRNPTIATTALALALLAPAAAQAAEALAMTIWKSPWCGCCTAWAEAMTEAGYAVAIREAEDLSPVKRQAGVPVELEGCHTASLEGYFLEGHVPLEAIDKLLAERPDVAGLSVPGMPAGSLGMGYDPEARYDVHAVSHDGTSSVFHRVGAH